MSNIRFEGSSDFERVKRDYEELARRTAKLELENRRLVQTAGRQANAHQQVRSSQSSMFSQGLAGLAQMAMGYASVTTAINLASSAIREQRELQKAALDVNVSAAVADASVIKNLVGETSQVKKQTLEQLQKIATDVGVESSVPVKLGFSEAISKASGDRELAMDATRRAAQLNNLTPDDIATFAGGGVTLSKLLGTKDTREAFGFMSEVQARSPVVDPAEMMKELPGAIAAVTASDVRGAGRESSREAGALFAAFGQATQQKAAPTSTAIIQFSAQLEKFFQAQGSDPGTLAGRIGTLQGDKSLQEAFVSKLTGEAKFLPAMRQLATGTDSIVMREWQKNLTGAGGQSALGISADQFEIQRAELGTQGLTEAIRLGSQRAGDIGLGEERKLQMTEQAQAARIRELTEGALGDSTMGMRDYLDRRRLGLGFEFAQEVDPRAAAINTLKEREAQIREGGGGSLVRALTMGSPIGEKLGGLFTGQRTDEQLQPREREQIENIRKTIARLQEAPGGPETAAGGRGTNDELLSETREMRKEMAGIGRSWTKIAQRLGGDSARKELVIPIR